VFGDPLAVESLDLYLAYGVIGDAMDENVCGNDVVFLDEGDLVVAEVGKSRPHLCDDCLEGVESAVKFRPQGIVVAVLGCDQRVEGSRSPLLKAAR
jgi:hypothetical protein